MKKSTRKLAVRAQTVRLLADEALALALGGSPELIGVREQGFIMRDTVIVPTSGR